MTKLTKCTGQPTVDKTKTNNDSSLDDGVHNYTNTQGLYIVKTSYFTNNVIGQSVIQLNFIANDNKQFVHILARGNLTQQQLVQCTMQK